MPNRRSAHLAASKSHAAFASTVRQLRHAKRMTLRDLADRVGVGFTYLSKIENHKLEEGHGPSEKLIHKLSVELDANEDELLLLAEKVPEPIRKRVCERPEVFRVVAGMSDKQMDQLLVQFAGKGQLVTIAIDSVAF